jgi:Arc/MetJ-type ribon-helix-helix transcriptional regulator
LGIVRYTSVCLPERQLEYVRRRAQADGQRSGGSYIRALIEADEERNGDRGDGHAANGTSSIAEEVGRESEPSR